ncbi:hypothetical protein [Pseudomonas sp. SLFW]|nr:hypothetical protein [Pseudomonas sp. SLFW]NBB09876.1 hypothetical protein [Pseudomonas sp. SLFW]
MTFLLSVSSVFQRRHMDIRRSKAPTCVGAGGQMLQATVMWLLCLER